MVRVSSVFGCQVLPVGNQVLPGGDQVLPVSVFGDPERQEKFFDVARVAKKCFDEAGAARKVFWRGGSGKKSVLAWQERQEKCFGVAGVRSLPP